MEIAALGISFLALIVSIIAIFIESKRENRLNGVNLEGEYYRDIYKEALVYKIPKARGFIGFDEGSRLVGTEALIQELQNLRTDSLYFQYSRKDFFDELNKKIQKLEDYLVSNTKNRVFLGESQQDALEEIRHGIEDIYKLISDAYLGKKMR
jgi:hypothetical protein